MTILITIASIYLFIGAVIAVGSLAEAVGMGDVAQDAEYHRKKHHRFPVLWTVGTYLCLMVITAIIWPVPCIFILIEHRHDRRSR